MHNEELIDQPMGVDGQTPVHSHENPTPNGESSSNTPTLPSPMPVIDDDKPHYKLQYVLSGHTLSISSLKFSPDGSKLASACEFACFYV